MSDWFQAFTMDYLEKTKFAEYPRIWKRLFPKKAGWGQVGDEMMIGY